MRSFGVALAGGLVLLFSPIVQADEKHDVTISYVVAPPRSVPENLTTVAIIDAGVETRGFKQDERERKWSLLAADVIEAMLTSEEGDVPGGLRVARRDLTREVLREQDLRLAGLVEGGSAARAGKLLDVQGLIVSEVHIDIDVDRSSKSTLDWGGILGGAIGSGLSPYVAPPLPGDALPFVAPQDKADRREPSREPTRRPERRPPSKVDRRDEPRRVTIRRAPQESRNSRFYRNRGTIVRRPVRRGYVVTPRPHREPPTLLVREVEEVNRHITVSASFALVDAVTGETLLQFRPPPYRREESTSPDFFFGSLVGEEELDPVDMFIGELVERAARDFVSRIAPARVEYTYTIEARDDDGEAALRALRADDYEAAERLFLQSLDDKQRDETLFALGVVCELRGRPRDALDYYRRAIAADPRKDDLRVYMEAKERLAAHLPRIVDDADRLRERDRGFGETRHAEPEEGALRDDVRPERD